MVAWNVTPHESWVEVVTLRRQRHAALEFSISLLFTNTDFSPLSPFFGLCRVSGTFVLDSFGV
jgi:hypothetical protein